MFERVLEALHAACQEHYAERLCSLVVFGSVGRGTARPDSDVDVLIVADRLPHGRVARVRDFDAVERRVMLQWVTTDGAAPRLSPVFKTREELEFGSPLLLDMVDDALILHDHDGVFGRRLERLRERLAALGARRIWRDSAWYWDLKPDYRPGDVIEL